MDYKNILIPVDFDHDAAPTDSIDIARRLLSDGGSITLVAVVEDFPAYMAEYAKVESVDHIKEALRGRLKAFAQGQKNLRVAILAGKPGLAIPDLAEQTDADLIIVNSTRPGARDYFMGATASRVVRRSHCAVMVLR